MRRSWFGLAMIACGTATAATPISTLYSFTGGSAGAFAYGTPIEGADGYLYGTTWFGSDTSSDPYSGWGVVYKIKPDGSGRSTLHVFSGGQDGAIPYAPLLLGKDGNYYGATEGGDGTGAPYGTVYKISSDGVLTTLHTFSGTADGRFLTGALAQDSAGTLYGVAQAGGTYDLGTVFKLKPDGSGFKVLHHFNGADGYSPVPGLTLGPDGKLYGVTSYGAANGMGTVFSLNTDGSGFGTIYTFTGGADGSHPYSSLLVPGDGYVYGTTNEGGGSCSCGTAFKVDAAGNYSVLHTFSGGTDGSAPREKLALGNDGMLYGTTYNGGANGAGSAYKIATGGGLAGVIAFTYENGLPTGFTLGSDGKLYSSSVAGGANSLGAVFSVDPALAFSVPEVPTVSISASKSLLSGAESAVISWSSTNADSCEAVGDGTFNGTAPLSGERKVAPLTRGKHVYTMTCGGAGGYTSSSVTIVKTK